MPRLDHEKRFARQLKDRELQPSPGSWERLQGKLELERRKSASLNWWIGIAASVVGAVLILNFAYNAPLAEVPAGIVNTEIEKNENTPEAFPEAVPQVVVEDQTALSEKENISEEKADRGTGKFISEKETKVEIADTKKIYLTEAYEDQGQFTAPSIEQDVTTGTAMDSGETSKGSRITNEEIDALLLQAIAQVSKEMPAAGEVTDQQINALLAEARAEVQKEQILSQTATLDAGELLREVETELDHSFRQQVFEIIRDGLTKTRNAIVNIND